MADSAQKSKKTPQSLVDYPAKVCLTAAGCLIVEDQVLLVKHKKVESWLCPGGHIDPNELPHQAAEREFWEETGVEVEAYEPGMIQLSAPDKHTYVPNPVLTNLHWVSRANYEARVNHQGQAEKKWKQCEQHLNFSFLVRPKGSLDFKQNVEETDGIAWFKLDELDKLNLFENVQLEIERMAKALAAAKK